MTGDEQFFLDAAERLRTAAERAGTTPLAFLHDGISGRSADGSVTVWADALGRVRRTTIRRNTLVEGDEARLATAFTEAATAAAKAAADLFTPEALRRRAEELDGAEGATGTRVTDVDAVNDGVLDPRSTW